MTRPLLVSTRPNQNVIVKAQLVAGFNTQWFQRGDATHHTPEETTNPLVEKFGGSAISFKADHICSNYSPDFNKLDFLCRDARRTALTRTTLETVSASSSDEKSVITLGFPPLYNTRRKKPSSRMVVSVSKSTVCFLLLVLTTGNDAWMLKPDKCLGEDFNKETHVCCGDQLITIKPEWTIFVCCNGKIYNMGAGFISGLKDCWSEPEEEDSLVNRFPR
ncbi:hypothetical protein LSAT2_011690 [Lamellibrachia satsuma]|nr:hypothetical protein LSAT2_011690 [Lamellibrachia satsuma]